MRIKTKSFVLELPFGVICPSKAKTEGFSEANNDHKGPNLYKARNRGETDTWRKCSQVFSDFLPVFNAWDLPQTSLCALTICGAKQTPMSTRSISLPRSPPLRVPMKWTEANCLTNCRKIASDPKKSVINPFLMYFHVQPMYQYWRMFRLKRQMVPLLTIRYTIPRN